MARIARLFGWNVLATLADRGLPIIGVLIVAHLLGPKDFGAFGIAQNTANLVQVFMLAGMGTVAARFVAARRTDPDGIASVVSMLSRCLLASSVAGIVAAMIFAERLSTVIYGSPDHASDVRLIALYFTVLAWNSFQSSMMLGFEAMKGLVQSSVVGGVLGSVGVVIGAKLGGSHGALWALIIARGVRATMASIILSGRLSSRAPWAAPIRKGDWRLLGAFGAASFTQSAVYNASVWLSQIALVQLHPQGLRQMGLFHAANQFSSLMLLFQTVLTRVLMPYIGERSAGGAHGELRSVVFTSTIFSFSGTAALAIIVSICSPWIMAAAGAGFADRWPLLVLLAGVTCVSSVVAVLEAYLLGNGRAWSVLMATIPGMVLMIVTVITLIPLGAYALGWGLAAALVCAGVEKGPRIGVIGAEKGPLIPTV